MVLKDKSRYNNLLTRLETLEKRLNRSVDRVKYYLILNNCLSYRFVVTSSDYYDFDLVDRAKLIGVQTNQLCKSLIMENTAFDSNINVDKYNKYYCIIVQYEGKFNNELCRSLLSQFTNLPKKRFHFVLASENDNYKITGFTHNAVSPFAFLIEIPIILCQRCVDVTPSYLFLGGGHINVKLGIATSDLVRITDAITGYISDKKQ